MLIILLYYINKNYIYLYMSGYEVKGIDLDDIFQKKDDFTDTYRSTYNINDVANNTNMKDVSGNDLKDRYISLTSSSEPYNDNNTNVGFTLNGTDLNAIFSKKTTIIRYEVEMKGERGRSQEGGDLPFTTRYNSGIPYGADISFNVWLDSSQQYKVKKCFGGNPGSDIYNTDNSIRIGGHGGNSLALMENDTVIAVPGSGGGDGSGNSKRGASVFYRGMKNVAGTSKDDYIPPYYDVFYGGTPNYEYLRPAPNSNQMYKKLADSTIARFNTNNTIYQVNSPKTDEEDEKGLHPVAGYYYGLTAPYRNHWGGGGGWTSGGVTYKYATNSGSGSQFTGGKGGDANSWRRSASGGGGGAGMFGGGGGAETNTEDGYLGSPGGGSGSTYYNPDTITYGINIDNDIYPKPTKNVNAYITIKNLNTGDFTTITFNDDGYNTDGEIDIDLP